MARSELVCCVDDMVNIRPPLNLISGEVDIDILIRRGKESLLSDQTKSFLCEQYTAVLALILPFFILSPRGRTAI